MQVDEGEAARPLLPLTDTASRPQTHLHVPLPGRGVKTHVDRTFNTAQIAYVKKISVGQVSVDPPGPITSGIILFCCWQ